MAAGKRAGAILVAILLLVSFVGGSLAAPRGRDFTTAGIDAYVTQQMRENHIPGLSLAVVRAGEVLYLKGYGAADPTGRAVTPQTPFILGSVSKSFTALAVMQLAEAGKIDLDSPMLRYLPDFKMTDPAAGRITVRQLLNHTSGISRYDGEVAFIARQSPSISALLDQYRGLKLNRPVGARHEYSNLNYVFLGAIVEAVSGQPYGDYVQQRIFAPLEMAHSYTSQQAAEAAGMATGYQAIFGLNVPTHPPFRADNLPDGYLISCAEDMAHYLALWTNGGVYKGKALLSPASLQEMQKAGAVVSRYSSYGLGLYTNADSSVVWHGGSTLNFRSSLKVLHKEELGVVVLCNTTDSVPQSLFGVGYVIADNVISLLYGERTRGSGGLSLGTTYLLMDVAALLVVLLVVFAGLSLVRWLRRPGDKVRGLYGVGIPGLLVYFVLPIAVLVAVARAVAWSVVLANMPDYGTVVLAASVALLLMGVVKVAVGFRRRKR